MNLKFFYLSCRSALLISIVYDSMAEDIRKQICEKVPVLFVPNGINTLELEMARQHFNKSAVLNKNDIKNPLAKNIVYVGNIGELYKPGLLLEPVKELVDRGFDINYILVGDGASVEKIRRSAADMGISDCVYLQGIKNHQEVLELMLASDLAFYALDENFPYQDSALGTKVLEYVACKLPILSVSSEENNVYKLIKNNNIGIALTWENKSNLRPALEDLIKNDKYARNIERYYLEFLTKYDRKINNNKLYEEIIRRSKN